MFPATLRWLSSEPPWESSKYLNIITQYPVSVFKQRQMESKQKCYNSSSFPQAHSSGSLTQLYLALQMWFPFPNSPCQRPPQETTLTQNEIANGSSCHLDILERAKNMNLPEREKMRKVSNTKHFRNSCNLKT